MKRKKIKTVWQDYLTLTIRERRGLMVLMFILILQIVVLFIINTRKLDFPFPDPKTLLELSTDNSFVAPVILPTAPRSISVSRKFNPNYLTSDGWIELGLSPKQAGSVMKYISKGGKFRVKSDVKKIYGINSDLYQTLLPLIDLPDTNVHTSNFFAVQKFKESLLDINAADTIQLEKLRGIGWKLASRIVKYRQLLGGFNSVSQLKEVWGLNDTLFELCFKQVEVTKSYLPHLLDVNSDSLEQLSIHPYIGRKLASMICNYRKQHGPFKELTELKLLPLVSDEIFRKLAPYLKTG